MYVKKKDIIDILASALQVKGSSKFTFAERVVRGRYLHKSDSPGIITARKKLHIFRVSCYIILRSNLQPH